MALDHSVQLFPGKQIHVEIIRRQRLIIGMGGLASLLNHVTSPTITRNYYKTGFHFQNAWLGD